MEITLDYHVRMYGRGMGKKSQEFHIEGVHQQPLPVDPNTRLIDYHLDLHLAGPSHGFPKGELK